MAEHRPLLAPLLPKSASSFGERSIGSFGGVVLNVNNIIGPGMVALPFVVQQAGALPFVLAMVICCVLASSAGTMLCDAIQRIPGNANYCGIDPCTGSRYQFCDAVRHYYGRKAYRVAFALFTISLQASNIASMITSAQVVDNFLCHVLKWNAYLDFSHWPLQFLQWTSTSGLWPPSNHMCSLGFVICAGVCIPLSLIQLEETMMFQYFSFICLTTLLMEFIVQVIILGPMDDVPLTLDYIPVATSHLNRVFGVVAFSFAFVITVPAWACESKPGVSCNRVLWGACALASVILLLFGLFGAAPYNLLAANGGQNILLVLVHPPNSPLTRLCSFIFALAVIMPGVPTLAICVRYNLLSSGACSDAVAKFFGAVAPWVLTLFLYQTTLFVDMMNWLSVVFMGFTNFVIPSLLYWRAIYWYPALSASEAAIHSAGGVGQGMTKYKSDAVTVAINRTNDSEEDRASVSASSGSDSSTNISSGSGAGVGADIPRVEAVPDWFCLPPTSVAAAVTAAVLAIVVGTIMTDLLVLE